MDAFDTASPEFASPEMTEARAEVNDAAEVNAEGQIEVAPDMANPANPVEPVAPDMAAGTAEGAAEMSGGGESAGMGAMDMASEPAAPPVATLDPAAVIDQMPPPDDPAPAPGPEVAGMDDPNAGIVDPADAPAGPDDDSGSLAG
jgi:hypothetical protein